MWKTIVIGLGVAIGLGVVSIWIANEQFDHQINRKIEALLPNPC